MWLFWPARNRFSLDELRYLTEQLQKVQIVNEANKDFVIEALRSIAELMTYGDQHDPSFFDFFMEKQVMGEFARILRISTLPRVALQLLQTMSIMIQNLRSQHSIYYIFSNEHINHLITYSFDFQNDEMLSYYISFLRAISGKLNKNTISLLVKITDDEVDSFPLYVEAIRFAFHEETMIRIAVRALTLNVYHVGDESVNRFVVRTPISDYFSDIVKFFQKQCIDLDKLVVQCVRNPDSSKSVSVVSDAVVEIEDMLYYFSDIMPCGVPDLGRLITDNMLKLLVFPLLLPSLESHGSDMQISITTALYLLSCVLHIFKNKDLASTIAATLFTRTECPGTKTKVTPNGYASEQSVSESFQNQRTGIVDAQLNAEDSGPMSDFSSSAQSLLDHSSSRSQSGSTLRKLLLSYILTGDETQALGSLCFLTTLLQTKELDESMLDGLGILPQRKQHKKLLLQALVGEDLAEEQLFSSGNGIASENIRSELDVCMKRLEDQYGLVCEHMERQSPKIHRYQVLDTLVGLFCRSNISADVCWVGGWLFRQLLPHGEEEFTALHLTRLKDSHKSSLSKLSEETKGCWCDLLISLIAEAWKSCKKAIEASSSPKDPKSIILPPQSWSSEVESSITLGERMYEMIKVFVLQHQLLLFCLGGTITDQPPIHSPINSPVNTRANAAGLVDSLLVPGSEVDTANTVPCRIAFERGKERFFCFLALSKGTSGWVLLIEELPLKQQRGIVRVTAPLAGSNPIIDEKHPKWLHIRIRPSTLPFLDPAKYDGFGKGKGKVKVLVDGRWTLAFGEELACREAKSMVVEEMRLQQEAVEAQLRPLLEFEMPAETEFCDATDGATTDDDGS